VGGGMADRPVGHPPYAIYGQVYSAIEPARSESPPRRAPRRKSHRGARDQAHAHSNPASPDRGISLPLEDCENDDPFGFQAIVDAIGKALDRYAPDVFVDDSRKLRILRYHLNAAIDLGDEFDTEIDTPLFVPECRFVQLQARRAMEDDRYHLSERALSFVNANALAASQGRVSSGCAW